MSRQKVMWLIKDDGDVYPYTSLLARRKDMRPFEGTLKQAQKEAGKPAANKFPEPTVLSDKEPDQTQDSGGDDSDRISNIRDAIGMLDSKNPEHYTTDGKPRVSAIEQVMGDDITQDERDEAMANEPEPGLDL